MYWHPGPPDARESGVPALVADVVDVLPLPEHAVRSTRHASAPAFRGRGRMMPA